MYFLYIPSVLPVNISVLPDQKSFEGVLPVYYQSVSSWYYLPVYCQKSFLVPGCYHIIVSVLPDSPVYCQSIASLLPVYCQSIVKSQFHKGQSLGYYSIKNVYLNGEKSLGKGQHLFHFSHFGLQTFSSAKTVVVWSVCWGEVGWCVCGGGWGRGDCSYDPVWGKDEKMKKARLVSN